MQVSESKPIFSKTETKMSTSVLSASAAASSSALSAAPPNGHIDKAARWAMPLCEKSVRPFLDEAKLAASKGEWDEAVQLCTDLLDMKSSSPVSAYTRSWAQWLRAELYLRSGRPRLSQNDIKGAAKDAISVQKQFLIDNLSHHEQDVPFDYKEFEEAKMRIDQQLASYSRHIATAQNHFDQQLVAPALVEAEAAISISATDDALSLRSRIYIVQAQKNGSSSSQKLLTLAQSDLDRLRSKETVRYHEIMCDLNIALFEDRNRTKTEGEQKEEEAKKVQSNTKRTDFEMQQDKMDEFFGLAKDKFHFQMANR